MTVRELFESEQTIKGIDLLIMYITHIEFDEGHLTTDPVAAQGEIDTYLALMEDTQPPVRAEDNAIKCVPDYLGPLEAGTAHCLPSELFNGA